MKLDKLKDWILDHTGRFIRVDQLGQHVSYKGSFTVDSGAFYCPYIPPQVRSLSPNSIVGVYNGKDVTYQEYLDEIVKNR